MWWAEMQICSSCIASRALWIQTTSLCTTSYRVSHHLCSPSAALTCSSGGSLVSFSLGGYSPRTSLRLLLFFVMYCDNSALAWTLDLEFPCRLSNCSGGFKPKIQANEGGMTRQMQHRVLVVLE